MTTTVKKSLGSHKKILAVDDEHSNIKLLEAKLAPEGYTLDTATNGQEALDKVKTSTPSNPFGYHDARYAWLERFR